MPIFKENYINYQDQSINSLHLIEIIKNELFLRKTKSPVKTFSFLILQYDKFGYLLPYLRPRTLSLFMVLMHILLKIK